MVSQVVEVVQESAGIVLGPFWWEIVAKFRFYFGVCSWMCERQSERGRGRGSPLLILVILVAWVRVVRASSSTEISLEFHCLGCTTERVSEIARH